MADVHAKLDELTALVESAKSMPLSSSCVMPRGELLAAIDEVRQLLPSELAAASTVLSDRESVVSAGQAEAEAILARAKEERARLVGRSEVAQEARRQADELIAEATGSAELMRTEVEDYVDSKLANFEIVLHKTLTAVERGRSKLQGRGAGQELGGPELRGDADLDDEE